MKVILTKEKSVYGITKKAGEEVEVRPEIASRWIEDGAAKPVTNIEIEAKSEVKEAQIEADLTSEKPKKETKKRGRKPRD